MEHDYPSILEKEYCDEFDNFEFNFAVPLNSEDCDNKTALYLACENGHVNVVDYLLRFKVKGRIKDHGLNDFSSSYSVCSEDSDMVEFQPFSVRSRVDASGSSIGLQSESSVVYKRIHEGSYHKSYILIAVKNQHRQVVEKLIEFGASLDLYGVENDVKYNVLLKQAVVNNDLLMLNKLLEHHAVDVNNFVFEETFTKNALFVSHLLQYRVSEDKINGINKVQMEEEYKSSGGDNIQDSKQYEERFPKEAVNVRWQNLKVLTTVEQSWLVTAAKFMNQKITILNTRLPLYAITRVDVSNNSLIMVPAPLLQLPSLVTLHLSNNEITEFPSQRKFDIDCKWMEDIQINHNKLQAIPDYIFSLPKLRNLNAANNHLKQLPANMWHAESLNILNLSHNHLEGLPKPVFVRYESETLLQESQELDIHEEDEKSYSSMEAHVIYHSVKHASHWSTSLIVSDEQVKNAQNKKKGIRTLKLTENKIKEFPDFLSCCCPNLENLEMSKNKMKMVGNLAAYPIGLKTLDLSGNLLEGMEEWQAENAVKKCYCSTKGYVLIKVHKRITNCLEEKNDGLYTGLHCKHCTLS